MQNNILIKFFIKSVLSTIISIIAISFLSSYIIYKYDFDLSIVNTICIIIYIISSMIISYISTLGFKNNGVLMGIISIIPMILYSAFTLAFGNNTIIYFAIKCVIAIVISSIIGLINTKKSKKFKV